MRLRVGEFLYDSHRFIFQFQFGAIKRQTDFLIQGLDDLFQFQFGAIKSLNQSARLNQVQIFQFQFGAIKSNRTTQAHRTDFDISIPVWCD